MASAKKTISTFGVEGPITTHAWSPDGQSAALSHNNREVKVYKTSGGQTWNETATLGMYFLDFLGRIELSSHTFVDDIPKSYFTMTQIKCKKGVLH